MSELIVSKFGGTSNSTAETVAQSAELGADSRVLVTSAPGRLSPEQLLGFEVPGNVDPGFLATKVTDQLLEAHNHYHDPRKGEIPQYIKDSVTARYAQIVNGLGITALRDEWLKAIAHRITNAVHNGEDYASMLGERLQAEIYQALGWHMLDPGRAVSPIAPDNPKAWQGWYESQPYKNRLILPGNTWYDSQRLRTFSRGGSDISGALAAYAITADVYRNMTDTPAQSISPKLMPDDSRRRTLSHLTYKEGRELGRNGTGLLHPAAIVPLMGTGIPTEVRNTFDPDGPYTLYTDEVDDIRRTGRVMAISVIEDSTVISVHEPGMSERIGRVAELSAEVANKKVSAIDVVSGGSDTELFIVEGKDNQTAQEALGKAVNGHGEVTSEDWALITLVGYQLKKRALDIRFGLAFNADMGKEYQFGNPYWFEGEHSLRFTVKPDKIGQVVENAHYHLIENNSFL